MKSIVKRIHCPDLPGYPDESPTDHSNFMLLLQVMVGLDGYEGEESFDIQVATSGWINTCLVASKYLWSDHWLVVDRFEPQLLEQAIHHRFSGVEGRSWQEIALRLARLGHWEFEDYEARADEGCGRIEAAKAPGYTPDSGPAL